MPQNDSDFAVIIGFSNYAKLPVLGGAENDAKDFLNWVTHTDYGNIPANNCHLFPSQTAPHGPWQNEIDSFFGKINTQIKELKDNGKDARRLYFYFSGHGIGLDWANTALVLPPWSLEYRNAALSSAKYLTTIIQDGKFDEVFFFLDCCRDRLMMVEGFGPLYASVLPGVKTHKCASYGYFACEFTAEAFEAVLDNTGGLLDEDSKTHGLFTKCLLQGLKGGAAFNGEITTESLRSYLSINLPKLSISTIKRKQTPRFFEGTGNAYPLKIIDFGTNQNINTLKVSFTKSNSMVTLLDGALNVIKQDNSDTGPWEIPLKNGIYAIHYDGEPEKYIKITSESPNPYVYEY